MAEAIGIAAAALQMTELTVKILSTGYAFLDKTANAPTDIRQLLTETAALDCVLSRLRDLTHLDSPRSGQENALLALQRMGVFDQCYKLLASVDETLMSLKQEEGEKFRNLAKRIAWPLHAQKKVQESLDRLRRMKETLSAALETNTAQAINRIETQVNQAEWQKVFSWACPVPHLQMQDAFQNLLSRRHPGTGSWLVESEQFKSWVKDGSKGLLWITGLPGAGKSILCATAVEALPSMIPSPNGIMVFFFCNFEEKEKATLHFLMSIAAQFISSSTRCFDIASSKQKDKKGFSLTTGEYITLVESFMSEYDDVFIVVDALDEIGGLKSDEKEAFIAILSRLMRIQTEPTSGDGPAGAQDRQYDQCSRKMLITSREDSYIRTHLSHQCESLIWSLDTHRERQVNADLEEFVSAELQKRTKLNGFRLRDPTLALTIQDQVLKTAGTFLQANLQLDYITESRTDREVRQALKSLPNGLNATYEQILVSSLQRYPRRESELREILQWLAVGLMPLSAENLAEVTSVDESDTALDFEAIVTDPHDVVAPLGQLVSYIQTSANRPDSETIIHLHHATVKEFLTGPDILTTSASMFHFSEADAHAFAAERCLQYLAFSDFDVDAPGNHKAFEVFLGRYSFLYYAATKWAAHMRLCSPYSGRTTMQRFQRHLSWFTNPTESPRRYQLWKLVLEESPFPNAARHSAAPITYAIANGLDELADALLPALKDINGYFPDGSTCLLVAATVNNTRLARRLLSLGARVDVPDRDRQLTPLHVAAEHGGTEMVALLLEHGASPSARSHSGTTPFYRAARNGSVEILTLLREAGSEVDAFTWDRWTPLMEAVENGQKAAVELLLGWGADPGNTSKYGITPRHLASHELKSLILEAEANARREKGRKDSVQSVIDPKRDSFPYRMWQPARIG